MADFTSRAFEIHSQYVWDFDWIKKSLYFIKEHDMTTLVLHRNDIVDKLVYPAKYFGAKDRQHKNIFERYQDIHRSLYKFTPTRRSGPYHRRDYINRVIELANSMGIDVFFENKELWFHEIFLELRPELTKDGTICPSEPFWWEFVRVKYQELFEDVPGVAGIITAPATGESRLSISANRCQCQRCQDMTPQEWYRELIMAMYEPIHDAGKSLVIRDFVFNAQTQSEIADVMEKLPEDVTICLKNTPHDYYPTFPDNARIGHVGPHPQWVEIDTMAQYFGWGVGPAIMLDDMRYRMGYAKEHGVDGVIFRTDWESLDSHSCFHTPNLLNLYGGAALSKNRSTTNHDIYRQWLVEQGMTEPHIEPAQLDAGAQWIANTLGRSWQAVKRSLYTNDCVFSDSSLYPVSLDHAWWLAEEKNSLRDWDPSKNDAMNPDEHNVQKIMAEKDEAVRLVQEMIAALDERPEGITDTAYDELQNRFDIFLKYVQGWRLVGHATALTKYLLEGNPGASDFAKRAPELLDEALADLANHAEKLRQFRLNSDERYSVYVALGWERLLALHDDLIRRLEGSGSVSKSAST